MDLTPVIWFVVGAAVAWFVEWYFWDRPTRAAHTRRFEEDLTLARNETEKIRVELRDSRDRVAALEREVGDVRSVLKAESEVRATAESKLLASDKKSVDLTAELARTRAELQAVTARAALIPGLEASASEWEQKHTAQVAAQAAALDKARADEARFKAQLSDWEARLRAEAESRAMAEERALSLDGELDTLRAELAGASQRVALIPTLETNAASWEERYRHEYKSREHAELKTGEVNAHLDKLRAQVGDWEARFKAEADARAAADRRASEQALEVERLTAQIAMLERQQQDAFSADDQQAGVLSAAIARLQAQVGDWEARHQVEAAAHRSVEIRASGLTDEVGQLDALVAVLQQQQQDAFAAADLQANGLSIEIEKLRAQVETWRSRHSEEAQARRIAQARAEDLAAELETSRGELITVHERVALIPTLEASATDWEAKFKAEVGQRERYQQEIQAYEDELAQRGTQVSALETAHNAALSAQAAAEQRAAELEAGLAGQRAAASAGEAQRVEENTARAALEAEKAELQAQLTAHEERLSGEALARQAADERAGSLKGELDKLRAEIGSLSSRVTLIPTLESSASSWEQRYQGEVALRTQLDTTVREREVEIARLREMVSVLEAEGVSRTAALQSQMELFTTQQRVDNLEAINGIGKVFARKLVSAGVLTFEDLARTPVERILEIIQPKNWQKIEPEAWVLEAAGRAGRPVGFAATPVTPDPLIDINGIGEVYARKLNESGIQTFAQLAGTSPERLREILNPEEWQKFEPEAWVAEAADRARRGE